MSKKRLVELEILRAFAFMMIVVQHTIGGYSREPKIPFEHAVILKLIYAISKSAVPMFVFISGISLYYTYRENINLRDFYKKRINTVILPYVICTYIYIRKYNIKVHSIIISLINGDTMYHLWYMGMNIRLILTFPIFLFIFKKIRKPSKKFDLIFIAVVSVLSYKLIQDKDLMQSNITKFFTPILHMSPRNAQDFVQFISISPIFYLIYFVMGIYFVLYYDKVLMNIEKFKNIIDILFIILIIPMFLILMHVDGNRISFHFSHTVETDFIIAFNICSIFFWYYISLIIVKVGNKITELLRVVSHYSFTAYLYHVLIINSVMEKLTKHYKVTTRNYIFPSMFYCITTIILAPMVANFLTCFPWSKYIFGCSRYEVKNRAVNSTVNKTVKTEFQ